MAVVRGDGGSISVEAKLLRKLSSHGQPNLFLELANAYIYIYGIQITLSLP